MFDRVQDFTRVLLTVLLLGVAGAAGAAGAAAQTTQTSAPADPGAAPQAASTSPAQLDPHPANPAGLQIDKAEITARANRDVGVNVETTIAGWQRELERLENNLRGPRLRYSQLNGFRDELQRVRSEIEEFSNRLQAPLTAAKAQLDLLGPAPAAGQAPEAETVARNRTDLSYHVGLLSAAQAAVHSSDLRVEQLINAIQDIRRKNFTSNLFQPVPGIYAYQTWARLPDYVPIATSRVRDLLSGWWTNAPNQDEIARVVLEAALMWLILTAAAWYGVRRLRHWPHASEPPFWRRASSAAGVVALRIVPLAAPIVFLYAMITEAHTLPERVDWILYAAAQSTIIVFALNALVTTVFAPTAAHWRLIPASDRAARRICGLVLTLAVVYGLTTLIYSVTRIVQAPFALTVAVAFPASLLLAGIVAVILLTPLNGEQRDGMPSLRWLTALRIPTWIAIAGVVVSALAGYLALSRFLAQQLIVTGSILALVYLLLLWVDGFTQALADDGAATGRFLEQRAGLGQRRREQLALPVGLFLKTAVLVLSVPLILLQWGYTWPDIYEWYRQLFFGFHIGNTQVSFAVVLASLIVFGVAYAAARLFQGWLDTRVLKRAGISGGVRDSIRIGVGYVGIVIAALAAFSYAGFNLSNLAIVAGAFSVGIGFGLQSVVNNFVSGLILLAERPIKVGDLVMVGGEEGTVRKISVRSTEVETSERARVLIPNSYLITEKVKNWTLRDNLRRIAIAVPVAHGSDPREVKAILLKVAQDNPNVMTTPAPSVELEDFGADSLQLKLYAFIDLSRSSGTSTDLRITILEAFSAAGITTPWGRTGAATPEATMQQGPSFGNGKGSAKGTPHPLQLPERQDGSLVSAAALRVRTSVAG